MAKVDRIMHPDTPRWVRRRCGYSLLKPRDTHFNEKENDIYWPMATHHPVSHVFQACFCINIVAVLLFLIPAIIYENFTGTRLNPNLLWFSAFFYLPWPIWWFIVHKYTWFSYPSENMLSFMQVWYELPDSYRRSTRPLVDRAIHFDSLGDDTKFRQRFDALLELACKIEEQDELMHIRTHHNDIEAVRGDAALVALHIQELA